MSSCNFSQKMNNTILNSFGRSYSTTILFQDLLIFRMFALGQSFCKNNDKFTKSNSVLWAVCLKVLVSLTFSKGLTGYLLHTAEWICGLWQARTRWQIAKIMILLSGLLTRTYKLEDCCRDFAYSANIQFSWPNLTLPMFLDVCHVNFNYGSFIWTQSSFPQTRFGRFPSTLADFSLIWQVF